jgi:hypothetical protein
VSHCVWSQDTSYLRRLGEEVSGKYWGELDDEQRSAKGDVQEVRQTCPVVRDVKAKICESVQSMNTKRALTGLYWEIGVVIFGHGHRFPSFLPTKIETHNFINLKALLSAHRHRGGGRKDEYRRSNNLDFCVVGEVNQNFSDFFDETTFTSVVAESKTTEEKIPAKETGNVGQIL